MTTLEELVNYAVSDLEDWLSDNPGDDPTETISEITDSAVPISTYELARLAADNILLLTLEPDIYAFDGKHTPINAIAGNVYEYIEEKLRTTYERLKPKYESLELLKESIPHGSGINGNWLFELDTNNDLILASNSYEAMNEAGFYCCDWPFTVVYDTELNLIDISIEEDTNSCECGYSLDDYLCQVLEILHDPLK